MRAIAICGSPRRQGNTCTLAERFLAAAKARGADTTLYWINGLHAIKGCQHCRACKGKTDKCIIRDDATPILADVAAADIVVYATPVYFGDVSAQFKLVFDRHYAFVDANFAPRLRPGKKALMILSQGDANEKSFADVFPRYEMFLKFLGFAQAKCLRLCGAEDPQTAASKPELLAQAERFAEEMCSRA